MPASLRSGSLYPDQFSEGLRRSLWLAPVFRKPVNSFRVTSVPLTTWLWHFGSRLSYQASLFLRAMAKSGNRSGICLGAHFYLRWNHTTGFVGEESLVTAVPPPPAQLPTLGPRDADQRERRSRPSHRGASNESYPTRVQRGWSRSTPFLPRRASCPQAFHSLHSPRTGHRSFWSGDRNVCDEPNVGSTTPRIHGLKSSPPDPESAGASVSHSASRVVRPDRPRREPSGVRTKTSVTGS